MKESHKARIQEKIYKQEYWKLNTTRIAKDTGLKNAAIITYVKKLIKNNQIQLFVSIMTEYQAERKHKELEYVEEKFPDTYHKNNYEHEEV
jgi:hypothetical protein